MDQICLSLDSRAIAEKLGIIVRSEYGKYNYRLNGLTSLITNRLNFKLKDSLIVIPPAIQYQLGNFLESVFKRNHDSYKDPGAIASWVVKGQGIICVSTNGLRKIYNLIKSSNFGDIFATGLKKNVNAVDRKARKNRKVKNEDVGKVKGKGKAAADLEINEGNDSNIKDNGNEPDETNERKVKKEIFVKLSDYFHLTFVKEGYAAKNSITPNFVLEDDVESISAMKVSVEDLITFSSLYKYTNNCTLVHTMNGPPFSNYIKPAVLAISEYLPSICCYSPRIGLMYDAYYTRLVFLKSCYRFNFPKDEDIIPFIKERARDIALVLGGFSQEHIKLAKELRIPILNTPTLGVGLVLRHKNNKKFKFSFISYLSEDEVNAILNSEFPFLKYVLPTSYGVAPRLKMPLEDFDINNYLLKLEPTALPFVGEPFGIGMIRKWEKELNEPFTYPGVSLLIVGSKGGMKSFCTKYVNDMFKEKKIIGKDGISRSVVGRVDSDAYGKWLNNPSKTFATWDEFDEFQNDDTIGSFFEDYVRNFILKKFPNADDNYLLGRKYTQFFSMLSMYMEKMMAPLLNAKDTKGLGLFVNTIMNIPDLPVGLLVECHFDQEISRWKSDTVIHLDSPIETRLSVISRERQTSSPLIELSLHDVFNRQSCETAYPKVYVHDFMGFFGYRGPLVHPHQ